MKTFDKQFLKALKPTKGTVAFIGGLGLTDAGVRAYKNRKAKQEAANGIKASYSPLATNWALDVPHIEVIAISVDDIDLSRANGIHRRAMKAKDYDADVNRQFAETMGASKTLGSGAGMGIGYKLGKAAGWKGKALGLASGAVIGHQGAKKLEGKAERRIRHKYFE